MSSCSILKDGIYYSGDTKYSMLGTEVARKAEIIIHETRSEFDLFHPSIEDLVVAPANIRSKTYLTHYRANELEILEHKAKEFGFAGVLKKGMILEV